MPVCLFYFGIEDDEYDDDDDDDDDNDDDDDDDDDNDGAEAFIVFVVLVECYMIYVTKNFEQTHFFEKFNISSTF